MSNLVVQTYGRENEYQRAILAVLSYHAWLPATDAELGRTVVFTDCPDYLRPYLAGLPVDYKLLTPAKIRQMKGPTNFVHRLKIAVLEETFAAYPETKLFYLDSDTFVRANPAPLLAGLSPTRSAMHVREYQLAVRRHEETGGRLLEILENEPFRTARGVTQFGQAHTCWNAGVLGLAPTAAAYLPDVFRLTDKLFAGSGSHVSEQLAFSLLLQTHGEIVASDHCIYHYWEGVQKVAADALLPGLLTTGFAALPLAEKLSLVRSFTQQFAARIADYLGAHPEIGLRLDALYSFSLKKYAAAYRAAGRYLLRKPTDLKFMRDVLYYTRQGLRT